MPAAWRTGAGWPPGWNWPRAICAWWPQRCRPGPGCIGGTKRPQAVRRARKGQGWPVGGGGERARGVAGAPEGEGGWKREGAPRGPPDPEPAPQGVPAQAWQSALQRVASAGAQACSALAPVSEMAPDLLRLHQRGCELLDALARFCGPAHPDAVRWVEVAA